MSNIDINKTQLKNKSIYVYPTTEAFFKEGNNTYIQNLRHHLSKEFSIINQITKIGLFDILIKLYKTDIIYFNWIEDIPDRKYGFLQVHFLQYLLILAKLCRIKIVWFVHNNISHNNKNLNQKKKVIKIMNRFSDLILSHSNEINIDIPFKKIHFFHHPLDYFKPIKNENNYKHDLLIWGTVSIYKGVKEFVEYASTNLFLKTLKIKIAGNFNSKELYEYILNIKSNNIIIDNKTLPEDELIELFKESNYIFFTYNSDSVLSSAALCKSLSYGKEIIGPKIGSFKELGKEGLIYTYNCFGEIEKLLNDLEANKIKNIELTNIKRYYQKTNWNSFSMFLNKKISNLYHSVA